MLEINIYNVGQGDAILLQWKESDRLKVGIIDCNKFESSNKIRNFLIENSIQNIEFIILTHFHLDHFSGFSEIFECCVERNIKIKYFLHTFASQILDIYDQVFYSKREESEIEKFMTSLEKLEIEEEILVDYKTGDLALTKDISMSFHAPSGKTYRDIANKIHSKNKQLTATRADINRLSTIIRIANGNDCVLFTSDAEKKSFTKIRSLIKQKVILAQIPHHGSASNIDEAFWKELNFDSQCPIFVSVGDEPKDKLPKKLTIEFFDKLGFKILSTNPSYGIAEYFGVSSRTIRVSKSLDIFSKINDEIYSQSSDNERFYGDKLFQVFNSSNPTK